MVPCLASGRVMKVGGYQKAWQGLCIATACICSHPVLVAWQSVSSLSSAVCLELGSVDGLGSQKDVSEKPLAAALNWHCSCLSYSL